MASAKANDRIATSGTAFSIDADSVPGWDLPLTDQELDDVEAAVQIALPKRPRLSVSSVEDEPPSRPRRRLDRRILYPVMTFKGRIVYSRSAKDVESAAVQLLKKIETMKSVNHQISLGFDIEWKPTFRKGVPPGKTAVMQVCGGDDHCHVMHIIHSGIPPSLRLILEDCTILKVGVGISNDINKVLKDYNISIRSFEDLSNLANQKLDLDNRKWGLASLTEMLISKQLLKPNNIRLGNWEAAFLSKGQLLYAATDAFASWHLYQVLKSLPDVRTNCNEKEEIEDEQMAPSAQ